MIISPFTLNLTEFPKLQRVETDGVRHYVVDEEQITFLYPSVTTILSSDKNKQKAIAEWRERVGHEEADRISARAAQQGTIVHEMIENYIKGVDTSAYSIMPNHLYMFRQLRSVADKYIDHVRSIEGQMFSNHLRCAGTVDMVAEFDGKLSIIDWKTSAKWKKKEYILDYFKQESAYAVMFEELTGTPVSQLVTVIATEYDGSQIFIERRDDWIEEFIKLRDQYEQDALELQNSQ